MRKDYCDRCGKEIIKAHRVSIVTTDVKIKDCDICFSGYGYNQEIHVDLCDDCVDELKLQMLFKNRAYCDVPKDDVKEQFFKSLQELVKSITEEN